MTGDPPVAVALVGAGAMGEIVARRVYARSDRTFRLAAVVDDRPQRAQRVAAELGATACASLEQALSVAEIDAVDVRVPHDAHAPVALQAIARGLHVLVDKPLATSLADADALVAAADRQGIVAAVAENYPHLGAVRAAAAQIESGTLGSLRALRTTRAYTLDGVWVRDGWRTAGPSAGILLDQGTHHTSLLRALGGEITSVSAARSGPTQRPGAGEETVLVTSRFASGLAAQSIYAWDTAALDDEAEATVFGAAGRIEVRVSYEHALGGAIRIGATSAERDVLSPPENYYDSHRTIVKDWVACIRDGGRPVVSFADAREDLRVVLAAVRSLAEDGRPIQVLADVDEPSGILP